MRLTALVKATDGLVEMRKQRSVVRSVEVEDIMIDERASS